MPLVLVWRTCTPLPSGASVVFESTLKQAVDDSVRIEADGIQAIGRVRDIILVTVTREAWFS